jgi:hypothetical protein
MWLVTTEGDLPDENARHKHEASVCAWQDYQGRILELEIQGYTHAGEEATEYGRRWVSNLSRGVERMCVTIERVA